MLRLGARAQEEEIRHSAGGERPDYIAHFGLIAARAVKIAAYLSGRPVRTPAPPAAERLELSLGSRALDLRGFHGASARLTQL